MTATNKSGSSRTKLVLFSSIILLAALCIVFAAKYTMLKLRVAFADGQVAVFQEMNSSADRNSGPRKIVRKVGIRDEVLSVRLKVSKGYATG